MAIDLVRARHETPGCARVAHFDNAGAGLMPTPVLDATTRHLRLEAEIGGYEASDREAEAAGRVYGAAAALRAIGLKNLATPRRASRGGL